MKLADLKLGIYEKALPSGLDWPRRLAFARKNGFQFVEMSIDESNRRLARLDWDKETRKKFVAAVQESGLTVPSICLSGHRRFPFGSHKLKVREQARVIMEKAIALAVDTGIRTIQLAGYDVYYEDSDENTRQWFLEGLKSAVALASRENVMLAMEIMDYPLMNSIVRYLNYYHRIPSPWFQVYPDLGNLSAWGNDVPEELRLGMAHIVAIHLKDTLAVTDNFAGQFRDVPFGEGCVNFIKAFQALHEAAYTGPFLIEMWTEKAPNPEEEVRKAREWILRQMVNAGFLEDDTADSCTEI